MDMLNADLALLNEVEKWNRSKKNIKRKKIIKKNTKKQADDESGFHFIAYVPIKDEVWRLDGMQRTPLNIGTLVIRRHSEAN